MDNNNFWLEIGISPRELDNLGNKWIRILRGILSSYPAHKKVLIDFFKVKDIDENNISDLKSLASSTEGKELYGLYLFVKNRIDNLTEFFTLSNKNEKIVTAPDKPLLGIIEIYRSNPDLIMDAAYYDLWKKLSVLEVWKTTPPLNDKIIENFNDKLDYIYRTTRKLMKKSARLSHSFNIGNNHYFCFERAKDESVVIGFGERKTIRRKGVFCIKIEPDSNRLEIRTKDPRVGELLSRTLASLNYSIFVDEPEPVQKNVGEITRSLLEFSTDKIVVKEIVFNYLEEGISCQSIFKESKYGDLKSSLQPLIQKGIIDPSNSKAIRSFKINVNGAEKNILVEREEDYVKFVLSRERISDESYQDMTELLKSEWGLAVGTDYFQDVIDESEKKNLLQGIINKPKSQLSPAEILVYNEVNKTGIFKEITHRFFVCSNCSHPFTDPASDICPKCKNKLIELQPRQHIEISEDKFLEYLHKKLSKIFGSDNVNIVESKKKGVEKFINIQDERTEVFLYPYYKGRIKDLLKEWNSCLVPSLQIVIGKKVKEIQEFELSHEIYLYDLLFDTEEAIKKEVEDRSILKYQQVIRQQTDDSIKKLRDVLDSKIKLSGTQFEIVCYPPLKYLFYGLCAWGTKQSGKTVPDGIYGIKMTKIKKDTFSMIYDCKISKTSYDLDADEKRKARGYIKRANQSEEIKKFSKTLSAYVMVAHNVDDDKFKKFANDIELYKKWKGKIILLQLDKLMYLYGKFEEHYKNDNQMKIALGAAFAQHIMSSKDRQIILNENDVDIILKLAESLKGKLNISEVLNHLVSNVEY